MAETYQPPANLKDFNRATQPQALFDGWDQLMNLIVNYEIASRPAFYNALNPPSNAVPLVAAPEWTGLPRTIKRLVPESIAAAARLVENPIRMGEADPMFGRYTPSFFDTSGAVFPGPAYRPQDEYLEWVTRRAPDGTITEIIFTCEGPEYWDHIARDEQLLLAMYKELLEDNSIQLPDLLFPRKVRWRNPNARGIQTFEAGEYNPYNKWNMQGAVHLTQPANTLGAEISLAKDATRLYGSPVPVTADPDLACCALYGGVNRMSDPTIGSGVNTQVQIGNRVTLRNPIGLYMKVNGIRLDAFALPDDTPFQSVRECFEVLRPAPAEVTDMIVRARFRVPQGLTFNGAQLRVGDLKVNGEKIVTGGQVADVMTMTLFAQAIPGAPPQQRVACLRKPCPDPERPDFIHAIELNEPCPQGGFSPLALDVEPAAAPAAQPAIAAADAVLADSAAEARPKTKHGFSRTTGGNE